MPYNSPYTGSIAQLMLRKGDIEAQRQQATSDAWSRGVGSLANLASSTLTDIRKRQEQAPQLAVQKLQTAAEKRKLELDALSHQLYDEAGGDKAKAADLAEQRGYGSLAHGFRTDAETEQDSRVSQIMQRVSAHQDAYGQAVQLGQEVTQHPELYPKFLPQFKGLANRVNPSGTLAQNIPDTYNPTAFSQMMQAAERGAMDANKADAALKKIQTAGQQMTGIAGLLAPSNSPEEWENRKSIALAIPGVTPDMVAQFGDYSPESVARASAQSMSPGDREKVRNDEQRNAIDWDKNSIEREKLYAKPEDADPLVKPGLSRVSQNFYALHEAEKEKNGGKPLTAQQRGQLWAKANQQTRDQTKAETAAGAMTPYQQAELARQQAGDKQKTVEATQKQERQAYEDYVRQHEREQSKLPDDVPYEPAQSFDKWKRAMKTAMPTKPILGAQPWQPSGTPSSGYPDGPGVDLPPIPPPPGRRSLADLAAPAATAAPVAQSPAPPPAPPKVLGRGPQVGQTVIVKGRPFTVGKVYPDGSWDPVQEVR